MRSGLVFDNRHKGRCPSHLRNRGARFWHYNGWTANGAPFSRDGDKPCSNWPIHEGNVRCDAGVLVDEQEGCIIRIIHPDGIKALTRPVAREWDHVGRTI